MATTTIGRFVFGVVRGSGGSLFSPGQLFVDNSTLEGVDVDMEAEGVYLHNAAPIVDITFSLTDGVNPAIVKVKDVSDEQLSFYVPKYYGNSTGSIVARYTAAEIQSLNDGTVTLTVTFTPATGTAVTTTHEFLNNAGGTRQIVRTFVDQATGSDANNALSLGAAAATMGRGIRMAATTANPG
jgi:hypothetical protein